MADRAVGEHSLQVGLDQCSDVAHQDREHAQRHEHDLPVGLGREREVALGGHAAAGAREKELFEAHLAGMKATFKGLASESLEASNKSFLGLATERMKPLEEKLKELQNVEVLYVKGMT